MNMRQKLRCILTIMGIITVCTACIVQKDPVDNSDDSGTKKKSFGKYDIMKGWSESDYSRDEKYVYVKKARIIRMSSIILLLVQVRVIIQKKNMNSLRKQFYSNCQVK